MAFLSIRHKPHQREAIRTKVIDRDTGLEIPFVIWADDERGRYRQHLVGADGKMVLEFVKGKNGISIMPKSKIFKGNIELRRVA